MEQDLAKLRADVSQRAKQNIPRHQIDPLDDVIFKVIFGRPERKELLIAFINDVLGFFRSGRYLGS